MRGMNRTDHAERPPTIIASWLNRFDYECEAVAIGNAHGVAGFERGGCPCRPDLAVNTDIAAVARPVDDGAL